MTLKFVLASVGALAASAASADFELQITEIWPGNEPGDNLTDDWFEITNVGDMPWSAATDGNLWYDDDSADPTTADLISGVDSIAPGESVVLVDDGEEGAAAWAELWGVDIDLPQVGYYDGSGLSQGGDGVSVWISADPPVSEPDLFELYPDAELNGGQSYDVLLGEFSTVGNASGAVATTATNDVGQPAIASPGTIPAPASALLVLGGLAAGARRRR